MVLYFNDRIQNGENAMKNTHLALILLMIFVLFFTQAVSAKDTLIADTGFRVGKDGFRLLPGPEPDQRGDGASFR